MEFPSLAALLLGKRTPFPAAGTLAIVPDLTELANNWEQWFASHWSETQR